MSLKHAGARLLWRPLVVLALVVGIAGPALMVSEVAAQSALPEIAEAAPESAILFQSFDLDFESEQWQQAEELLARVGVPDALETWRQEILTEGARSGDFSEADLDALLGGEMAIVVTPPAIERLMALEEHMRGQYGHGMMDDAMSDAGMMADDATPHADMMADDAMSDTGTMADDATPAAGMADAPQGWAVILQPGDPEAAWAYAERQVTAYAQEKDLELQVASGPGTDLIWSEPETSARKSSMDDPMAAMFGHHGHRKFAVGHSGGYIIASKSPADVTAIMDVIDGVTPSLADSDTAQMVTEQLPAQTLAFTYIDAQAIVDSLDPEIVESLEGFVPEEARDEPWGGYAGMALSAGDAGFRLDAISQLPEGADISAFVEPNDPAIAAMAESVPAEVFLYQAGVLPPNAFAGAAFNLAVAVNASVTGEAWGEDAMEMFPSPEEMDEQITMAADILGFNPATDLFDLLGGEFIAFSNFPSIGVGGFNLDAVAAVSTTEPGTLADTMEKLAAWIGTADPTIEVSTRQVGEDTVYVVGGPEMEGAPTVEFGVVDDQAVIAVGEGIEALMSEPADALAEEGQFQEVMGLLPAEYSQVAYIDLGRAIQMAMIFAGANDMGATADATPVAATGGPENVRALAMVTYQEGESAGTSVILYIPDPGA